MIFTPLTDSSTSVQYAKQLTQHPQSATSFFG